MVAILLIPQAIAYAYLAGMPPQYGLYAALIPILLYALLGTSPHVAIGPVAISAILILAGVSQLAQPFTPHYIELAILAGFLIGIIQAILGILKKGNLTNFLSYPVITGFTSAASIIIISSQLKDTLGLKSGDFDFFHESILHIFANLTNTHLLTFIIAIVSLLFLIVSKRISQKIPSGLIVVFVGILISYFFDLESKGVDNIGFVPSGLPSFIAPTFSMSNVISLIPTVLLVSFIGVVECIGIAQTLEKKNGFYKVDADSELIALGISKIGGSFFGALPSSASYSRSAILHQMKAKTTISSIISVVLVVLSLLFLTPLLYYLPKAILAVIIIYAVKNLFEFQLAKKLFSLHKLDFLVMLITFLATLMVKIEIGVAIGFLASFVMLYTSKENILKKVSKVFTQNYIKAFEFSDSDKTESKLKLIIHQDLHFGNIYALKKLIKTKVNETSTYQFIEFNFVECFQIDSSAAMTFREILKLLDAKEINYDFVNTGTEVNNILAAYHISPSH